MRFGFLKETIIFTAFAISLVESRCMGSSLQPGQRLGRNEFIGRQNCRGYRFGVQSDGDLVLIDDNDNEVWNAGGAEGDSLRMQNDENLVFYDGTKPIWATQCFGTNVGAEMTSYDTLEVRSSNGRLVWMLDSNGNTSSRCYPYGGDPYPQINCVGEYLYEGQALYKNDYIGPYGSCGYRGPRFGLDKNGFLGAFDGNEIIWHSGIKGDELRVHRGDGNVVLYKDGYVKWASNCFGDGVRLRKYGKWPIVEALDQYNNVVWELHRDGHVKTCYP